MSSLSENIGHTGTILLSGLSVSVRILDGKVSYGNPRYLITPVSGTGSQWVSAERVQIVNSERTDGQ